MTQARALLPGRDADAVDAPPRIEARGSRCAVSGTFFRAVEEAHVGGALDGSQRPGRYSRPGQRTLYLSASREGVAAAMIAHSAPTAPPGTILRFRVDADGIVDLRQAGALEGSGLSLAELLGDWQGVVARGGEPASWRARQWIEDGGANGLIDPSRKAPGLWHLVLFRWNMAGAPTVTPALRRPRTG